MLYVQAEGLPHVSIHAPARGAAKALTIIPSPALFRSTLPRGERLGSATPAASCMVFRSTLPRGERPAPQPGRAHDPRFDPRSRAGSGGTGEHAADAHPHVSIHAPARGAAWSARPSRSSSWCFDPRSRAGSGTSSSGGSTGISMFRSTLPRGERHRPAWGRGIGLAFRSTLPRGERPWFRRAQQWVERFRSTLPRGERLASRGVPKSGSVFRSTLPRGERRNVPDRLARPMGFDPRSRAGSGINQAYQQPLSLEFRSTLPRGERLLRARHRQQVRGVSIHAPARGAALSG